MDVLATRLSWRRLPWALEIVSIGIFYALYSAIRLLAPNKVSVAFDNATQVANFERALGLYGELGVNQFLSRHPWLEVGASYYYVTAHYAVTTVLLAWLWRHRRRTYAPLRSALVLSSGIALVIYATWPLAPPRYAMSGAVDTVNLVLSSSGHGVSGLVNDLAAMPSMHVGWALWCAVVVVHAFGTPWRHLAWLYPLCTTAVVVATANHYLLDAVVGALVVALPLYLCGLRPSLSLARTADPRAASTERCTA